MRSFWTKGIATVMAVIITLFPISIIAFAEDTPDILVGYQANAQVLVAGTEVDLVIPIENKTSTTLNSLLVSLDDPSKYPFDIKNLSGNMTSVHLGPKESRNIYLPVKIMNTAEAKTYAVGLVFSYRTEEGSTGTMNKTIYVKITNTLNPPKIEVRKTEVSSGYIGAGETSRVYFDLLNSSDVPLKEIKVSFKDLGTGLYPAGADQIVPIAQLAAKNTQRVGFDLKADDKAETKSYAQTLEITFKDEYNKTYTTERKVYIPVRKTSDQMLDLSLESIIIPERAKAGSEFTVSFDLANHSQFNLQNVTAKLEVDAAILSKSAPIQQARIIEAGKSHGFSFKLFTKGDIEAKNYPIKALITYEVGSGNEQKSYYEYLNIEIGNASGKTTPKVIVSNYSYGGAPVLANSQFPLSLTFSNTNEAKPIYNAKITLVSAEAIFTPVNASNSFFIDTIGANGKVEKSVMLMADYGAKPKNYPIEVKIDYEDADGKAFSQSDTISIPIMQELVPRLSKIEIPGFANLNTPTQMSLTLFNIGKAEIRNIFVTIEGDNIVCDQGETYLGNLGEGSDTYFDGTFMPTALGEQKGIVRIKYQDGSGKEYELTHDFTVAVEEMPQMEPGMDGMPPMETPADKWIGRIKIGAGVVLLGIIGFVGIRFFKAKKARKQAEKL